MSLIIRNLRGLMRSRALKYVSGKRVLADGNDQYGKTLYNRRLQDLVILIFKVINGKKPEYLRDLFALRNNVHEQAGRST